VNEVFVKFGGDAVFPVVVKHEGGLTVEDLREEEQYVWADRIPRADRVDHKCDGAHQEVEEVQTHYTLEAVVVIHEFLQLPSVVLRQHINSLKLENARPNPHYQSRMKKRFHLLLIVALKKI